MPYLDIPSTVFSLWDIAARVGLAALLGAAIGFEREVANRSAGLKTHMMVAAAAATFAILTLELYALAQAGGDNNADPIRIIEAVTAGVAFLAAGTIIRRDETIRGLTTGAGMWMAGAAGVAAGTGYFALAFVAVAVAVVIMTIVKAIEDRWL